MTSDCAIDCRDVTKTYTDVKQVVEVLRGVNLQIRQGESVAIVGASGAGKTTLLQILGGLDTPTSGSIRIAGQDLSTFSEKEKGLFRNKMLGFIYQFHHLLPEFSAIENVALPLRIRGLKPAEAEKEAEAMIVEVGLKNRLRNRIGDLSGGERQRIAIARALVTKPRCILADEPTGNLDQETAAQVFERMLHLNQTLNTSLIMVTHNRELAQQHDRVLELVQGQLEDLK